MFVIGQSFHRLRIALLLALCSLTLLTAQAQAGNLEIPLRIPFDPIRQALSAQLATSAETPNVIYQEGPCRYLHLDAPHLEAHDGQLRFSGSGAASLGAELFGTCHSAADWHGTMEFTLAPQLDSAGHLRLRIVDSKLTDASGKSAPSLGFIWELSKQYLNPRLEQFSYDIGASRETLLAIIRSAAPPAHSAELEQALSQLQILEPRIEAQDIVVPIAIALPEAWLTAPSAPTVAAAPLTETELETLDKTLQPWDAFLVYSIKQIALDSDNSTLRKGLFDLLLNSRYRLTDILSGEQPATGDPIRELFMSTWSDLRALLADAQREGLLDADLLRYALFINAGDALAALDHAAPGLGMQISTDGLRRLARSLRPGDLGDPLAYDEKIDPQLRQLFNVDEIPDPMTSPAPTPTLPGQSWLEIFITSAHATDTANSAPDLPPLDRWVPKSEELIAYTNRLAPLLQQTANEELQRTGIGKPYDQIFRNLVPTTALIESCWHQYVRSAGKPRYLRSQAGSVGLMQINQHVWRGFYDVERLKWDTAYNARAGTQILMRYMKDYAIDFADRSGDLNHIPRATYSVYNAGPRAVGRFNKPRSSNREQRVDQKLWTLYQGIAAGGHVDLSTCSVITTAATP